MVIIYTYRCPVCKEIYTLTKPNAKCGKCKVPMILRRAKANG